MGLSCTLVFVGLLWMIFKKLWGSLALGRFSKNYKMFVRIRDIGRGRLC